MTQLVYLALFISGLFAVALGIVHFFMPRLLDFDGAIPAEGDPLRPFRLGPIRYPTTRPDVRGIAWVMNHAASYTILSIGVLDLAAPLWLATGAAPWLLAWAGGFWLLRAATQLHLGHRRGDRLIMVGFGLLALVHFAVIVAPAG